jgi:hypothetical protein
MIAQHAMGIAAVSMRTHLLTHCDAVDDLALGPERLVHRSPGMPIHLFTRQTKATGNMHWPQARVNLDLNALNLPADFLRNLFTHRLAGVHYWRLS